MGYLTDFYENCLRLKHDEHMNIKKLIHVTEILSEM